MPADFNKKLAPKSASFLFMADGSKLTAAGGSHRRACPEQSERVDGFAQLFNSQSKSSTSNGARMVF